MAAVPGLTPGFKFAPDDDEVIEFFLVPRLRGQPLPLDGVVIDDDPGTASPWELFTRNGLDQTNGAYFFAPGDSAKSRKVRDCAGIGTWVGQKPENKGKLRVGEETFEWQKYRLNFHYGSGKTGSLGWVMLEYSIVVPDRASFKVCHISFTGHGQKRKRVPDECVDSDSDAAATHHQFAPPAAAAAAPSSSTTTSTAWNQNPSATHDHCHQEHFVMQPQAHNGAAPGVTDQYYWSNQEPLATTTTTHQFVDCRQEPFLMQSQAYNDAIPVVDGVTDQYYWTYQDPLATMTHQFADHGMQPMVDLGSFGLPGFSSSTYTAPAMDHGMMPLQIYQQTWLPEQSVEYCTMPPSINQDPRIQHSAGSTLQRRRSEAVTAPRIGR